MKTLTLTVLAAMVTGMAFAQEGGYAEPPRPQGQGGFGQGPGGPPPGRMMMGGPGGGARVLLRPEVQKELKLSEDQIEQIRRVVGQGGPGGPGGPGGFRGGQGGGRPGGGQGGPPPPGGQGGGFGGGGGQGGPPPPGGQGGGFGGGQGGPPPPRGGGQGGQGGFGGGRPQGQPMMDPEQMQRREKEMDRQLQEILNDSQFKRYKQLALQQEGAVALRRDDIADKVGLSEEQRDQIHGILERNRPRPMEMQEGGTPPDPEVMRNRMDGLRDANNKKILAVLNGTQKEKWEALLGKPFKFERPQMPPRPPQDGFGGGGGN